MSAMSPIAPAASRKRWWLWLPLLVLAGWLALFGDKSPPSDGGLSLPLRAGGPGAPSHGNGVTSSANGKTPDVPPDALAPLVPRDKLIAPARSGEGQATTSARDLFSVRNWNPPAPAPAGPPPAPVAPPLPYAFIGKKLEGDTWEVYLGQGEQTYVVREGQVIEGVYRVDKIAPPTLALTYLPLGQAQTLSIGETR
jgi:hypothetical protein